MSDARSAVVATVSRDAQHRFSKQLVDEIVLIENHGVEGDAHAGATVRHAGRLPKQATKPNLRQVHLIAAELLEELREAGFAVEPAQLGENVGTRGVDVLGLPRGTLLRLGASAVVEVTGLRNPCRQVNEFQPGLLKQLIGRDAEGRIVRKVGIMGVVRSGGPVRPGDAIQVELPAMPHVPLDVV